LDFRNGVIDSYAGNLKEGSGEFDYSIGANFGRKWGWYTSIYALAQGDVTKFESITRISIHQALMYLEFEKEKIDLEKKMIKK